jgi:radical SAM superfamily enzyme YgiQ (UPF0313 family)
VKVATLVEKICLIQPPIEDYYTTPVRNIPLGLLLLAAVLKSQYQIQLLDLRYRGSHVVKMPKEFEPLRKYYHADDASPFGLYKNYQRFGFLKSELEELLQLESDVYLISALLTPYADTVYEIIEILRRLHPKALIICGGQHAALFSEQFFSRGVDFVFQAEGERGILDLLEQLDWGKRDFYKISNLIWKSAEKVIFNPVQWIQNLDELPPAEYEVSGIPDYLYNGQRHAMIIASRGCPNHCRFCGIHQSMGDRYRMRSVENVLAELELKYQAGFRSFDFEDDHFGGDQKWLEQFLDAVVSKYKDRPIYLSAMNGITANNLDDSLLSKMWLAGFRELNLSLVSASIRQQDVLARPFGNKELVQLVQVAYRIGFHVTVYLIIGLPGDSPFQVLDSILMLAALPCQIGPSLFYLVPETPVFRDLKDSAQLPRNFRCYRATYFPYSRTGFSRREAMTLLRICRLLNFLKNWIGSGCSSAKFRIQQDRMVLTGKMNGKCAQQVLGFGLLHLLFSTGKLYGTGKKVNNYYPLVKEDCSMELLDYFNATNWQIHGLKQENCMTKLELYNLAQSFSDKAEYS